MTSGSVKVDCRLRSSGRDSRGQQGEVHELARRSGQRLDFMGVDYLADFVRLGSTAGGSVLTVTTSPAAATFKLMSTVAVCPTVSVIPVCTYLAKPEYCTASSYCPGWRFGVT